MDAPRAPLLDLTVVTLGRTFIQFQAHSNMSCSSQVFLGLAFNKLYICFANCARTINLLLPIGLLVSMPLKCLVVGEHLGMFGWNSTASLPR